MVLVMADLLFVKIEQGVAHSTGGVGLEVAFGRIEEAGGVGECFLSGQFDFRMGKAGDVGELAGDFRREG